MVASGVRDRMSSGLLDAQGSHGLDSCRPSGWNESRQRRKEREHQYRNPNGKRVVGPNAVELAAHQASSNQRDGNADGETQTDQQQRPS